jgi:AcrR family transcriptional regulator
MLEEIRPEETALTARKTQTRKAPSKRRGSRPAPAQPVKSLKARKASGGAGGGPKQKPRSEELIVAEATRFFADVGFKGQTRELAKRLGFTQPALYKHFANKSELIEKVYQAVFLSRWNPYWERLLEDRSTPLTDRLTTFYQDYARLVVDYRWIRITMQAALAGDDLTRRYVTMVGERLVPRICHAVRDHVGLKKVTDAELQPAELQLIWDLQGCIIYLAIREHVYGFKPLQPLEVSVDNIVRTFVQGAPSVFTEFSSAK